MFGAVIVVICLIEELNSRICGSSRKDDFGENHEIKDMWVSLRCILEILEPHRCKCVS